MTQDDSEVYNVDVRITSRPVAPNFESARGESATEPAHKAPKFENVSDEARPERRPIDASLPVAEGRREAENVVENTGSKPDFDYDDDDDDDSAELRPWYRRAAFLWGGLAVIVAVVALAWLLPQYTGSSDDPAPAEEFAADATRIRQLLRLRWL